MDKKCDYCDEHLTEWDYITDCGHSLCDSCHRLDIQNCLLCKKTCEFKLIGEKMSTNGTKFLSPISRVLNDAQDIVEFQISSLLRLVSFLREKVERQKELLQQVKQELSTVKEFKWELYHLREENELLKIKLNKQQQEKKEEEEKKKKEQEQEQEQQEQQKQQQEEEEDDDDTEVHDYGEIIEKDDIDDDDDEQSLYYHTLKKDDFSSQELQLWKHPFSLHQSRANEINYDNLL